MQFVVTKLVDSQRPTSCSANDGKDSAGATVPAKARQPTSIRMMRVVVISPNVKLTGREQPPMMSSLEVD
jgi:hypothetical protein